MLFFEFASMPKSPQLILHISGMATFFGLAYALEFPMISSAVAAGCTGLLLSIGLAISTQCRVVVCLCMPTLSLKTGTTLFCAVVTDAFLFKIK